MGEFSASASAWKKMVLARSDSEWTSIIKSESGVNNPENAVPFGPFSLGFDNYNNHVKSESEDSHQNNRNMEDEPLMIIEDTDPLLTPRDKQPRRRRGSGPKEESAGERSARLAKMSAYAAQRLATESPEQRAARLKRMSEYAAKRLATETSEQRAKRLARMSAYAAKRLAKESPDQRRARLSRMSAYAARRQAMKKHGCSSSQSDDTGSMGTEYDHLSNVSN